METKKTQVVELNQADVIKALAEYAINQAGGINRTSKPEVEVKRFDGTPGARGRDAGFTAVITFEFND